MDRPPLQERVVVVFDTLDAVFACHHIAFTVGRHACPYLALACFVAGHGMSLQRRPRAPTEDKTRQLEPGQRKGLHHTRVKDPSFLIAGPGVGGDGSEARQACAASSAA